jgi:6-phosphofructokinase 1
METEPSGASVRSVCILSGGGDAPGVNAIIRGFVHAARRRSIEVLGCHYGFEGLLHPEGIRPLALADVKGILGKAGSVLGCSTRVNPFYVVQKPGGETVDMSSAVVDRLRALRVESLVLIGGDGTMLAARRFMDRGLRCVGVPKTIDNDLGETDFTCGFDSAVEAAASALDTLHATAEAHARVLILEVMGRNAGWIALHAGLAGGADVILLPEIPYDVARVVAKIREREALGRSFTMFVAAVGARPTGGDAAEIEAGRLGHLPRLGGAGSRLMRELTELDLGHEVRLTVLGLLQRGARPTAFDRNLGTRMGTYAAELCARGAYDRMVALREGRVTDIPLALDATGAEGRFHKEVGRDDPMIESARLVGIELGAP